MARTTRLHHPNGTSAPAASAASDAADAADVARAAATVAARATVAALTAARIAAMERAVELEVDAEEFGLRSVAERTVWDELVVEFEARVAREGRSWVAAAA